MAPSSNPSCCLSVCRLCMLSLCLHGFFPVTPASNHSVKACTLGWLVASSLTVGESVSMHGCLCCFSLCGLMKDSRTPPRVHWFSVIMEGGCGSAGRTSVLQLQDQWFDVFPVSLVNTPLLHIGVIIETKCHILLPHTFHVHLYM